MNAVTTATAQLYSRAGIAATLQSVQITGQLNGLLLSMTTRQHYKNTGADNLEAVYTFPLPWGATLLGLNAEIDGHRLHGTVLERKQATLRYEKAIADGDTPIMVERSALGLYTANLGNLKPGESAVIEIEYAQLLRFEQGQIRITVPTTVAPRYGDGHKTGGLAAHESVDTDLLVEHPLSVKITLTSNMTKAVVQCPSHDVTLAHQDNVLVVSLTQGAFLDRDFVLLLQGLQGQSFATVAPDGDGFAVLASFCPNLADQAREPLLLKVLVDCSGSMGGGSISAARQALHEVLKELDDQDWVSYSRFGTTVVHDLPGLVPCSTANIKKAANFIAKTEADLGGTEMNGALLSTFRHSSGPDWPSRMDARAAECHHDVLLITDGDIWNVEAVIQSAKDSGHRVFAIGVGSAPGESLLREVAEKTGGACELVSPNQNVGEVIVRMFRRLRSPRCADIKVNWGQPVQWQSTLPSALYGGDTLHLCARMVSAPATAPTLSWVTDTAMQSSTSQLQSSAGELLPRLVATQQIIELTYGKDSQTKTLELALRYQLVTNQTNLILVHVRGDGDKAEGLPTLENITHMQAAGWGGLGLVADGAVIGCCASIASITVGSPAMPPVWRSGSSMVKKNMRNLADGLNDFELPASLRKQAGDNVLRAISRKLSTFLGAAPQHIDHAPMVTPLELLQAFDSTAQKAFATSRFVSALQVLNVPVDLTNALTEFAVVLGSDTKAWAVVIQWLTERLADQFKLSRQGERLLRNCLKDEQAAVLTNLHQQLTLKFSAVQADDWIAIEAQHGN